MAESCSTRSGESVAALLRWLPIQAPSFGPLSPALRERGAVVTGIDSSAGMLALARRRIGDDVALHVVDL